MNGKVQGIIVCGVIAASLAGVLVFLSVTDKTPKTEESSAASESTASSENEMEHIYVLDRDSADIVSIVAENENGGFTLDKPASGKSSWTVEEISSINQNTSKKDDVISRCGYLEASKIAEENAEDLAKYGLETPKASFTVNYSDGTLKKVLVGDVAPDSKYTYVKVEDESTVYMMLTIRLTDLTCSANDYANLVLIAEPASESEWPEYGKETISRSDWDYDVVFEQDPHENDGMLSSQVISEPIFAYLNITNSTSVTHSMWGLTASKCEAAAPSDEQLAEYGINDPVCTVALKGEDYDYKLTVGKEAYEETEELDAAPAKIGYYCTLSGVPGCNAVYIISDASLPWVTFKIEDVISNLMTSNYLVDLAQMSITADGKETVYEMTTNGGSNDKDENGKAADVQSVKVGGKEIDVYQYKSLYQYIMTCPTNELCFDEPEGDAKVVITQTRKDGKEDVIELYTDTARRYIVKLNGKTSFRIQSTWVDVLLSNMECLEKGEKISTTY